MAIGHCIYHLSSVVQYRVFLTIALVAFLAGCNSSGQPGANDAAEAQSLLEQRRIAEARLAIREAIAADDAEPAYHLIRGRIEFTAGSTSGAFNAYQDALDLDPTNREALQAVSQLGLQVGEFRASLEATDAILALDPNDLEALLTRGLIAVIQRRLDEADAYADRILAQDNANEGGTILKARVAFLRGESEAAVALIDEFESAREPTVGTTLTRLELDRERRDAAGLQRSFDALRTFLPDDFNLRVDEANFAFKTGRPREGLALSAASLAHPEASADLVRTAFDLWREYGVNRVPSEAAMRIAAEGSPLAVRELSRYLSETGQTALARNVAGRLPEPDRQALEAFAALQAGEIREAREKAQHALERDATHCIALTVQARVRLEEGRFRPALANAQQASSQCPNAVDAWATGATAYSRLGDYENARRMWRQGVAANPQDSDIARRFVDWLRDAGNGREALAVVRRLTNDAPALLSAWRLYLDTCRALGEACVERARRGLDNARTIYGIDLHPGEAPPNGLYGRLIRR